MSTATASTIKRLYVPANGTPIERHGGIVYLYQSDSSVPYAVGYRGKAYKPAFHFRFASEDRRTAHVDAFFASLERQAAAKAERRAAFAKPHTLKVGDVVVNSWGWEQTNETSE